MKNTLNKNQIKYVLHLLGLVDSVVSHYDIDNKHALGLGGLQKGLEVWLEKEDTKDMQLDTYLTFFIKTAVEEQE